MEDLNYLNYCKKKEPNFLFTLHYFLWISMNLSRKKLQV